MAYNLRYPQIQGVSSVTPQERMMKMELGIQDKQKQQLMAKINEYKIRPKNFAPEEVQFMQLKAMEMGIPFSTDVKTSTGHKISVAGGEFLDKLLFDLIPDNAKEAIFGRPMNESERKWASAAGTIGFLGGFFTPGAPAKLLMKGLRPKMVAMLGKNPGMLRSARNSMKAMGFKNPQILRDAVKAGRKGEGGAYSKFMSKGGTKGKTKQEVSTPAEMEAQAAKLSPTAQRGAIQASNRYVKPSEVGDVFYREILNDPAFAQAVSGARTPNDLAQLAKRFMIQKRGRVPSKQANAAMKEFFRGWSQGFNPMAQGPMNRIKAPNVNIRNPRYNILEGEIVPQNMPSIQPAGLLGQASRRGLGQGTPFPQLGPTSGMNVSTWRGF